MVASSFIDKEKLGTQSVLLDDFFNHLTKAEMSATRESNINNPREEVIVIEIQTFKDLSVKAGYGLRAVGLPSGHDLHSSCERCRSP